MTVIDPDYRLLVVLMRANDRLTTPIFSHYADIQVAARRMAGLPDRVEEPPVELPLIEQARARVALWRKMNTST